MTDGIPRDDRFRLHASTAGARGRRAAGATAARSDRRLAGATLALLVFSAVFAPVITHYNPLAISPGIRFRPPSAQHLFGTDHLGRDIFAIVLYGGRTSLLVGALVTAIAMGLPSCSGWSQASIAASTRC